MYHSSLELVETEHVHLLEHGVPNWRDGVKPLVRVPLGEVPRRRRLLRLVHLRVHLLHEVVVVQAPLAQAPLLVGGHGVVELQKLVTHLQICLDISPEKPLPLARSMSIVFPPPTVPQM